MKSIIFKIQKKIEIFTFESKLVSVSVQKIGIVRIFWKFFTKVAS